MTDSIFTEADVIHRYSTRDAVEDGMLVALSGQHYSMEGDVWVPEMVHEAGFRIPVLLTVGAFADYVCPAEDDPVELAPGQDIQGRLWDVLYMAMRAIRRKPDGDFVSFVMTVRENVPRMSKRVGRMRTVTLFAELTVDEEGPSIVIMRPEDR